MLFRSDRKSTRLNSSHTLISYAVFCLKKKKKQTYTRTIPINPTSAPLRAQTPRDNQHFSRSRARAPCALPSTLHFDRLFFFFNDTATTEIYTLSLHDALPI